MWWGRLAFRDGARKLVVKLNNSLLVDNSCSHGGRLVNATMCPSTIMELYDLSEDLGEAHNLLPELAKEDQARAIAQLIDFTSGLEY